MIFTRSNVGWTGLCIKPWCRGLRRRTHRMRVHELDVVFELGAHLEASVTDVTGVRSVLAVVLEMCAHAPSRRVRLPAQRTLKLLNTCTERECQTSTDVHWVWNMFYVVWSRDGVDLIKLIKSLIFSIFSDYLKFILMLRATTSWFNCI